MNRACKKVVQLLRKSIRSDAVRDVSARAHAHGAFPPSAFPPRQELIRSELRTQSILQRLLTFTPALLYRAQSAKDRALRFYEWREEPAFSTRPASATRHSVMHVMSDPPPSNAVPLRQLYISGHGRIALGLATMGFTNGVTSGHVKRHLVQGINDLFGMASPREDHAEDSSDSESESDSDRESAEMMINNAGVHDISSSNSNSHKIDIKKNTNTNTNSSTHSNNNNCDSQDASFEHLVQGNKLVLRKGDITPDQWDALSSFLRDCPHIEILRIQGVEVTAADAENLSSGLKQIRHIAFCENEIGLNDGSLGVLVALLLTCGMLESTSIERNAIADDHIPELVELLREHRSLSRISLSWNAIGDGGAYQISDTVCRMESTRLEEIDLSYNFLSEHGKKALRRAQRQRREQMGREASHILVRMHGQHKPRLFRHKHLMCEEFDFDNPSSAPFCNENFKRQME